MMPSKPHIHSFPFHTAYPTLLRGLRHSHKPPIRTPQDKREGRATYSRRTKERASCPQVVFPVRKVTCLLHISSYTHPNKACEIPTESYQDEESVKVWFSSIGVVESFQIDRAKHDLAEYVFVFKVRERSRRETPVLGAVFLCLRLGVELAL
ncbi:unnamed protein product [Cuscuta epithymum]|uniref:Uncharacterized protein n=1 Tax=Cuscuta epithymum TaxID=186058 RepID=A0AAV0BZ96_9ASTE|nr:unnamed protein product [Cuscuta epithymum]